jgi:hypothetical protein
VIAARVEGMADLAPRPGPPPERRLIKTAEFARWQLGLDPERRASVQAAIERVADAGPTLGRPRVDTIQDSRVNKLKEARVDRSVRVLFAFDSNRNAVMLVGGDKAGKWNRWYPPMVRLAARLLLDHERSIGKEPRCLSQREARRTSRQNSR